MLDGDHYRTAELVNQGLEEGDDEAAWERHCNEPEAWEGGFAENH